MNNTQKRYMKIPGTINISGKRTIRVLKRGEKKFNTKKFIQIIGLCILTVILLLMINKTEATEDIKSKEDTMQAIEVKEPVETQKTMIKWNNRVYAVQVWGDRIETMRKLGYSETRILDLLAIMNMECGSYKGDCFNGNDIGPMQINKIHKEQYNKSWEIYNREAWGELFIYQVQYANRLVESYEAKNCKPEYVHKYGIGKTYNQKRWRCVAFHYNGHPKHKFAYNKLGWERREVIKKMMYER